MAIFARFLTQFCA